MFSLFSLLLSLLGCRSADSAPQQAKPAHHTETGFRNLYIDTIDKSAIDFVKMKYFGDEPFADHLGEAYRVPVAEPDKTALLNPAEAPQVTWLGHSTFLIQYRGLNILTDPILSKRASPISFAGPERLVPMPVDLPDLPAIDIVIISHNHYDHLDLNTIAALGDNPMYLVPLKLGQWFVDAGIASARVMEFDWWDQWQSGVLTATATPSQHWSARGLFDRYETLWAAWHLQIDDFSLWFGGDTGYNPVQFKEVGARWPNIDLGLIPIGAYAPRWFMAPQHVSPEEGLQIHRDIGARHSIGMHWGTFQLSAEPIMEPVERLERAVTGSELNNDSFTVMAIGETRRFVHPATNTESTASAGKVP